MKNLQSEFGKYKYLIIRIASTSSAAFFDQGGVENVMADNSVITVVFSNFSGSLLLQRSTSGNNFMSL